VLATVVMQKHFPEIHYWKSLGELGKIACVNGCIALGVYVFQRRFSLNSQILTVSLGAGLYCASLLVANAVFSLNDDINQIAGRIVRLIRRYVDPGTIS
jgi:1,4-dihydroxy-2-naphthoate octaprenyltransferase